MRLTKLSNGSIILNSDGVRRTLSKYSILQIGKYFGKNAIVVKQGERQWDYIVLDGLEIEIQPDAPFSFSGNIVTLFNYLTQNIFDSTTIENFNLTPGNIIEITYYTGVEPGNPSGTTNIKTVIYKSGSTTIATKTLEYDASDNIIKITVN